MDRWIKGQMELYSPLDDSKIIISGKTVPLEKDVSVQLAYTLNQPVLWNMGFKQFIQGKNQFETGLYQILPHNPEKDQWYLFTGLSAIP